MAFAKMSTLIILMTSAQMNLKVEGEEIIVARGESEDRPGPGSRQGTDRNPKKRSRPDFGFSQKVV